MKKTILAAMATFALLTSASAQTTDNCTHIKGMLADLATCLKNYKGRELSNDLYEGKVLLKGYTYSQVKNDVFALELMERTTATTDKAAAEKEFHALVAEVKACLPGFTMQDLSDTGVLEMDFLSKENEKISVSLVFQDAGDFSTALFIRKNKDL